MNSVSKILNILTYTKIFNVSRAKKSSFCYLNSTTLRYPSKKSISILSPCTFRIIPFSSFGFVVEFEINGIVSSYFCTSKEVFIIELRINKWILTSTGVMPLNINETWDSQKCIEFIGSINLLFDQYKQINISSRIC